MRIPVVNVNTTESITDAIAAQAQAAASPGTEIVGLTPRFGAESVEGNFESYLAAIAVMDRVMRYDEPYDAVIQAGYGEHGREGLQELLTVPVVDITEAAASIAMLLGHRYSVVTTLDRTVPLIEDRLKLAGADARCASVRKWPRGARARGEPGPRDRVDRRPGAARCAGRSRGSDLPRLRRDGRSRPADRGMHGRAGRRRRLGRGGARRVAGAPEAEDVESPHVRAAAPEADRRLAGHLRTMTRRRPAAASHSGIGVPGGGSACGTH